MSLSAHEELARLLRPAGGGVYLVSTGLAEQRAVQQRLYGASSDEAVRERFLENLDRIAEAKAVIVAVPSDVGAGFLRGSNMGPAGIRSALLERFPDWPERAAAQGVVDLGDVFCVPQLLHDDMLAADQIARTRRAIYPGCDEPLPVSPLSIAERVWDLVFALNPQVKPFTLGGDHSTAWPVVASMAKRRKNWAIVQSDAHTDLLEDRLGVRICFGTWSFHANELIGRESRLVQVGIRATRRTKEHWESTLGVRQFWASEVRERGEDAVLDEILQHLRGLGVDGVYFSNDIDGTDASEADATGTPEDGGLTSRFLKRLVERIGAEVGLLGGDVMEVAPPLARSPDGARRTCVLAAEYLVETIDAALGGR